MGAKEELWAGIEKAYGIQCRKYQTEIEKRLAYMISATLYAKELEDYLLCKLDKAFSALEEQADKYR